MPKHKKTRILAIVLIALTVITIMIFSILPDNPVNTLSSPFSIILRPLEQGYSAVSGFFSNYFSSSGSNVRLSKENERLREENLALRLQIKDNEQAALAYQELKQAFALKDRYPNSKFLAANILQMPFDEDYAFMRIDQGTKDGLEFSETPGFAVVDENAALVGMVFTSDLISSKVLPVFHDGFSANVYAEGEAGSVFSLRGQYLSKKSKKLLLEDVPDEVNLAVGSKIFTSGQGGILPENIFCGTVSKIGDRDSNGYRQAEVEVKGELEDLHVVFVLLPQDEDSYLSEAENEGLEPESTTSKETQEG